MEKPHSDDTLRLLRSIALAGEPGLEVSSTSHDVELDWLIGCNLASASRSETPSGYPMYLTLTESGEHYLNQLIAEEKFLPVERIFKVILCALPCIFASWWLSSLNLETLSNIPLLVLAIIVLAYGYGYIKREESTKFHSNCRWFPDFIAAVLVAVALALYLAVCAFLDDTIDDIAELRYDAGYEVGYDAGYSEGRSAGYDGVIQEEYDYAYFSGWCDGAEDAIEEIEREYGLSIID